jgi:hypothetical protein
VIRQSRLAVTSSADSLELGGLLSLGGELSPNDGVLGESAHSIDGSACHPIQSQHSTRPDTGFLLPNGSERIRRLLKARKSDSKRRSPYCCLSSGSRHCPNITSSPFVGSSSSI